MKNCANILLGLLLMLGSCDNNRELENIVFPCNECAAVKMINRKAGNTIYFDNKNTMTLRAPMRYGHDSLIIKKNGVVEVALPNFKRIDALDDEKGRTIYFKSVSSQGTKGMRIRYLDNQEANFITSQLIDGGYRADADTVDIYYRIIN